MAAAKKKIVITIDTDTYDVHKAMDTAQTISKNMRESDNGVRVVGVQVK